MREGFPIARPGQKIGLLGGSFDPAHRGHVAITKTALQRFGLEKVWWLVSPGNPLKSDGPAPMARRLAAAEALIADPRVLVTDLEMRIGTRYTAETLEKLQALYPGVSFSWIMGADNLAGFHRWERWPSIVARVPIGVLARPGVPIWTRTARAARLYRDARIKPSQSRLLAAAVPPAWCYLPMPMQHVSSTEIRDRGAWER